MSALAMSIPDAFFGADVTSVARVADVSGVTDVAAVFREASFHRVSKGPLQGTVVAVFRHKDASAAASAAPKIKNALDNFETRPEVLTFRDNGSSVAHLVYMTEDHSNALNFRLNAALTVTMASFAEIRASFMGPAHPANKDLTQNPQFVPGIC